MMRVEDRYTGVVLPSEETEAAATSPVLSAQVKTVTWNIKVINPWFIQFYVRSEF